jgi:hypothetical protein
VRLAGGFFVAAFAGLPTATPAPSMLTRISLKTFRNSGSMAFDRVSRPEQNTIANMAKSRFAVLWPATAATPGNDG